MPAPGNSFANETYQAAEGGLELKAEEYARTHPDGPGDEPRSRRHVISRLLHAIRGRRHDCDKTAGLS
jgi:hypothetical protein